MARNDNVHMLKFSALIKHSPDPELAANRLDHLHNDPDARRYLALIPDNCWPVFIHLLALSNFMFRYFCRNSQALALLNGPGAIDWQQWDTVDNLTSLRAWKYQELLKITWIDLAKQFEYPVVLDRLSILADSIIVRVMEIAGHGRAYPGHEGSCIPFSIFAMGKLGAQELNYSSDVDLIFVARNFHGMHEHGLDYHSGVIDHIRKFNQLMQDVNEDGFLYRVDLKLRPWGRSGPLVLSIDETEHYYEASTEAWERFAWLRGRQVGGDQVLGRELLDRLEPFIYLRSLSADDLKRFLQIKQDMARQRRRNGAWNVKLGEGGIRDIEFFIQMLQIVNAHSHPVLKTTSTIRLLEHLSTLGFIAPEEGREIKNSYLFLRQMENRLQMIDEQQTHQLPDEGTQRLKIASSLGFGDVADDGTVQRFNQALDKHRRIARICFERILPGTS